MIDSNLQTMRTLIAKDWRLFRVPAIALLIVGTTAYLIAALSPLLSQGKESFGDWLLFTSLAAMQLTGVLAAAFGGIALAGERADRTADFVGLLPVTRKQIILSKWLVSFLLLIPFAAFHGAVASSTQLHHWFEEQMYEFQHDAADWAAGAALWIGCTMSFFGIAWLAGSFSRSAAISISASIAVSVVVFIFASYLADPATHVIQDSWSIPLIVTVPLFLIGVASLIAGMLYYLKRIEP